MMPKPRVLLVLVTLLALVGVLSACGGGSGGNPPFTVSGTVTAVPGGDTAGINIWVCTAADCPYAAVIEQGGASAPFTITGVPAGGSYTVEAGQDLNGNGVLDEGDAFGCYQETAQSCGVITGPAGDIAIVLHHLGEGGGVGTGISGVVSAPPGGDVAGTIVAACTDAACPFSTTVQQSGASAAYTIADVTAGQYAVIAWTDSNGNQQLDENETSGCHRGTPQGCPLIEAPATGVDIRMSAPGTGGGGGGTPGDPAVTYLRPEDFQGGSVTLTFDALGPDERIAVIPVHAGQEGDGLDYAIATSGLGTLSIAPQGAPAPTSEKGAGIGAGRHLEVLAEHLRLVEKLQAAGVQPLGSRGRGLQTQAFDRCPAPSQGTQCQFWVGFGQNQTLITATQVGASANAFWFVQNEALSDMSAGELQGLVDVFENKVVPSDTHYFGAFPDVDQNGKIFIVFNELIAAEGVLGYVAPADYFPDAETSQQGVRSNEGDVFYAATAGSLETLGLQRSEYFQATMPSTLVHELKHLIATGTRILAGNAPEELWIEEPSAQAAQELAGYSDSQGYSREALAAPQDFRLVHTQRPDGAEGLNMYGYNFLFIWRLAERIGHEAFWRSWTAGPGTGIANLEAHGGGTAFSEMMLDWATTLMFDHAGKVQGYDYAGIDLRDGSWQNLGYGALGDVAGTARSMAYYVGTGAGGNASVTISSASSAPYAVVVRFAGDLPWGATEGEDGGGGTPGTISGTVYAPAGGDVFGTLVGACTADDCPSTTTITQHGASAGYQLNNVPAGQYEIDAWSDLDGSGAIDTGDFLGCYSDGNVCVLVAAPAMGIDFGMVVLAKRLPKPLSPLQGLPLDKPSGARPFTHP